MELQAGLRRRVPALHGEVAAFNAGAGPGAGNIGYGEEVAPTLKASQSGNMTPAVLCLNGQGGWQPQDHEHPPIVSNAVFGRRRVDEFRETDVASTEATRQDKDVTDLVLQANDGPAMLLIRRLTPGECEALQGFPSGWTQLPGASDSARYRALGNSVAIPCVEFLMQGLAWAAEF